MKKLLFLYTLLLTSITFAQEKGQLSGSLESNLQYYVKDSTQNFSSNVPLEKIGYNGYLNLFYQQGNFSAGVRYEGYFPALLGYPVEFDGQGIANRFISYQKDGLEVTAGNFYEQYGNGNILRTLEQRSLGIDNSIDGLRIAYNIKDKAKIKGLIGKQRDGFKRGKGSVRGLDAEIYINQFLPNPEDRKTNITLGGSYVSKFQIFDGASDIAEVMNLNVDAFAGRFSINSPSLSLSGEYVHKTPDPTINNGGTVNVKELNLKTGSLQELTVSYAKQGLGIGFTAKRMYNMDYRTDREAIDNRLLLNFVTANTVQHTYRLLTWYPYTAQTILGEMSIQGDFIYSFKRRTLLGGKYGTSLSFNYALVHGLDSTALWQPSKKRYFQDFNVTLSKKWSKKLKTVFKYVYLQYNKAIVEGRYEVGLVEANTIIADILYKFKRKKSLRIELQHLATPNDQGNWAFGLLELSLAPHWIFYVSDEVNYGTFESRVPVNYYNFGGVYLKGANRFELRYGRQRGGLICVGGICRIVPEFSGLSFSITSSF